MNQLSPFLQPLTSIDFSLQSLGVPEAPTFTYNNIVEQRGSFSSQGLFTVLSFASLAKSNVAKAPAVAEGSYAEGSFSIIDWSGYPEGGVPRPSGPFRLLEGGEYTAARDLADKTNRAMHNADPNLRGLHIHEINPIKFGGSPTDPLNKIPLEPPVHRLYNTFWSKMQGALEANK
jgi:hypothetical protein